MDDSGGGREKGLIHVLLDFIEHFHDDHFSRRPACSVWRRLCTLGVRQAHADEHLKWRQQPPWSKIKRLALHLKVTKLKICKLSKRNTAAFTMRASTVTSTDAAAATNVLEMLAACSTNLSAVWLM